MEKDVLVTVSGLLVTPDGKDKIEITTTGKYYEKEDAKYIFFDEIGDNVKSVTKTSVKIAGGQVEVRKKGIINTEMIFAKDQKLLSIYKTPYGQMEIGVHTKDILIEEDECSIRLRMDYRLDINNEHSSDSSINILVNSR